MIKNTVLQNTDHYWLNQGDWEAAQEGARDLLGACDEYKIHHTTKKQLHIGTRHEERKTRSTGKTTDGLKTKKTESSGTTFLSVPEYAMEEEPVYQSGSDQLIWKARSLQQLNVGQCWVREMGRTPRLVNVPLVKDSWVFPAIPELNIESLSAQKVRECLILVKARPEYQTPIAIALPAAKSKPGAASRANAAKGANGSGNGSASIPRSSNSASGTIPPAKRNGRSTTKHNGTSDGS